MCMHVNTDVCRCMYMNADMFVDTCKQICTSVGLVPPSDALPENYPVSCDLGVTVTERPGPGIHLTCCSKFEHLIRYLSPGISK